MSILDKKGIFERLEHAAGLSDEARAHRKIHRLNEILEEEPHNIEAWEQLTLCYEILQQIPELRQCYRKLGNIYAARRDYDIALGYLDQAESHMPKINIGILREKLSIYFETQRLEEAYITAKKVIEAFLEVGERESALNFLRLLPSFGPSNPKWRRELGNLIPGKEGKTGSLLRTSWRSLPRLTQEALQVNLSELQKKPNQLEIIEPKLELPNMFNSMFTSSLFLPSLSESELASSEQISQQISQPPASNMSQYRLLLLGKDEQWREEIVNYLTGVGCQVSAYGTIEESWNDLINGLPSLVLAQQTQSDWDWCQLFAQFQANTETYDIPFICLIRNQQPQELIQALNVGVTDCWNWPQSSDEFIARVQHVLNINYDERNAILGQIAEISLPDTLQMLEGCRKTGLLTLRCGQLHGTIFFNDGRAIDAQFSRWQGEMAFYRLLQWTNGLFRFQPQAIERAEQIHDTVQGLLMDAMRRLDEQSKIVETMPAGSLVYYFNPAFSATIPISHQVPRLMELFNGQRTIAECLFELEMDIEALALTASFIQREVLIEKR